MTRYDLTNSRVKEMAEQAAKGFTPMPEGDHLMRVTGVTYKVIKEKDAWDLDLIVVPGEPCEHQSCRDTLFFSEKALGRVLLCLSAFGLKDNELAGIDPTDEKCRNLLVGRTAIVKVEHKVDKQNRTWANPTYAGYKVAHVGSVDEMKRNREAGAASGGTTPAVGGLPADKLGAALPF